MKISLKAARVNAEMTQLEAANAIGVSRDAMLAWENGKTSPKIERVVQLCHLYNISPDNIFLETNLTLSEQQRANKTQHKN